MCNIFIPSYIYIYPYIYIGVPFGAAEPACDDRRDIFDLTAVDDPDRRERGTLFVVMEVNTDRKGLDIRPARMPKFTNESSQC